MKSALEGLLASYREQPAGHWIGRCCVPSRSECRALVGLCLEALFPGFGQRGLGWENLPLRLRGILQQIEELLTAILGSQGPIEAFIDSLPELRRQLMLDATAALDGDPAASGLDEVIAAYPGFLAVVVHRLAHRLHQLEVHLLPRMLSEWAHSQTGADIHPAAQIGERFFIDHATGVVIGATAVVGARVRLYQGVTLGALSLPRNEAGRVEVEGKRHPTLEDDVTIYANATILGGKTVIGQGCVIGGSVFLTRSVPPGHRVILDPPKLRIQSPVSAQQAQVMTCEIDFEI